MRAVLLVLSPDRKGLVAMLSGFLFEQDANILHADQHQDRERNLFFSRIEFEFAPGEVDRAAFEASFQAVAAPFALQWQIFYREDTPGIAIFVSKYLHCLDELLERHHTGELPCRVACIVSNHGDAAPLAAFYGIPFHVVPVTAARKTEAENQQMELLTAHGVDLIVLARYMQVLSPEFVRRWPNRIINVHHSFLPAFSGAKPYHQAAARGVKIIGATSHYVTDILDDGPIIDQQVVPISHRDGIAEIISKGKDCERQVLYRGVKWHLDRRILTYDNKTVVFD